MHAHATEKSPCLHSFDDLVDVRSFEEASLHNRLPFLPLKESTVQRYAITLSALVNYAIKLHLNHPGDDVVPQLSESESEAVTTYVANPTTATAANLVLGLFEATTRDRGATTVAWFVRLHVHVTGHLHLGALRHGIVHLIYAVRWA